MLATTVSFPHVFYFLISAFTAISVFMFCKLLCRRDKNPGPPLPPGPISYPIIGCLPSFLMNKPTFRWIHNFMREMGTEIACFRIGSTHVIPITSPELACAFLKTNDAILSSRPMVTSAKLVTGGYLGTALTPYGDQWKKMRKVLVSHVLSTSMHKQFHDKRCVEADEIVRCIYHQCRSPLDGGVVNVRNIAQHYCCNVIKQMIFSKRSFGTRMMDGSPGIEDQQHLDAAFTILSYLYGFGIADFVPCLEVFDFEGHKKVITNAVNTLKTLQDPEVDERVEMWKKGAKTMEEDVLDQLINLKDSENNPLLTTEEIKAQINEMVIATVDNPSNAVEWSLAEMLNQRRILDKARKELDEVVGRDRLVQESDLPKLNYIKACAKESLRLHPIAPFNVPHVSSEDVVVGGYLIPKGSQVLLSRPGLGRNPRIWDDPLKYNPERHMFEDQSTEEVVLADHELRMLSFSTGRRGCPGIVLGSTLTTMLLARLIQGFDWKESPEGLPTTELNEVEEDTFLMKKPLIARATPRLEQQVYMQLY